MNRRIEIFARGGSGEVRPGSSPGFRTKNKAVWAIRSMPFFLPALRQALYPLPLLTSAPLTLRHRIGPCPMANSDRG